MTDRPDEINSCYVCVNISCREGGSEELRDMLIERLAGSDIDVKTHICFGACWMGPNIVLYPKGTWYSNVQSADIDEIVAHIRGGPEVQRLINSVDPGLYELVVSILDAGLS
ncbi:MAG TPA: (2Fe-2S) ferredoxin domain-containing protein [Chloroflexota bacterium]|nr:(2Fe-2S) ferredoxin domain-containing protein [Chloroflexota bacterium]